MKIEKTLYHCTCGRCGATFDIVTAGGPSEICGQCAVKLLKVLYGRRTFRAIIKELLRLHRL